MKRFLRHAIYVAPALLLAVLLLTACVNSNQSSRAFPMPVYFEGEYSQNGGAFQPLTAQTRLNALEGDLILRGSFDPPVQTVSCYLDHIYMSVAVNGEVVTSTFPMASEAAQNACGAIWFTVNGSAYEGATVEIRLSNPHSAGNPQAYTDFLRNLYTGGVETLSDFILNPSRYLTRNMRAQMEGVPSWLFLLNGQLWRWSGLAILTCALLLLGVALADVFQNRHQGSRLFSVSLTLLFGSGAMLLDTTDVVLWSEGIVFNAYAAQICRMLAALTVTQTAVQLLRGRRRTAGVCLAIVQATSAMAVALTCLTGRVSICDILTPWLAVQAVCFAGASGCCAFECARAQERTSRAALLSLTLLCIAILAEIVNARFGWWRRSALLNTVVLLLFAAYLVWSLINVPRKYRRAKRADQLEQELTDSRISIMLSQIQPHFLYNALTAIARLCELDPPKAKATTLNFAQYLRGNLDSLSQKQPILFGRELQHTRIYTDIEKIRFGEMLNVTYDIQTEDFLIPALTLQPLVENAVKHGVGKSLQGGTVSISAREADDGWHVTVRDDGVGFDAARQPADGRSHVGIENVRRRLARQSGGTLAITSTPGAGTVAEITLPREKAAQSDL